MSAGILYIVPTPIGNLKDITFRAIEVLKDVDLILAEDTRQTIKLLKYYNIEKNLISYHKFNEFKQLKKVINRLLAGEKIALVSDAGTPGISDPGHILIKEALENNIKIVSLPGPTAFVPALLNSGFSTEAFVFEGFLPHKKGRNKKLKELASEPRTIILYISPHKLLRTLSDMELIFEPDRMISLSRELSKIYEENVRGTIAQVRDYFLKKGVKGEFTMIIEGLNEYQKRQKNKNND